jgi:hypothetical protein
MSKQQKIDTAIPVMGFYTFLLVERLHKQYFDKKCQFSKVSEELNEYL